MFAEEIEQVISCSEVQFGRRSKNTYQRGSKAPKEATQSLGGLTQRLRRLAQRTQKTERQAHRTQKAVEADTDSVEAVEADAELKRLR